MSELIVKIKTSGKRETVAELISPFAKLITDLKKLIVSKTNSNKGLTEKIKVIDKEITKNRAETQKAEFHLKKLEEFFNPPK